MFFSFDGIDGVGKSTQIALFVDWLRQNGHDVVACRDPGSTAIGEAIRDLLLGHRGRGMSLRTEALLYMAARAQMIDEIIRPAIESGKIVVADRFLLANIAYQGYGSDLGPEAIRELGRFAVGELAPDLTFLLDMPEDAALRRLGRPLDEFERRKLALRTRIRQGYLAEAAGDPQGIAVINADQTIDQVRQDIRAAALPLVQSRRR